MEFESEQSEAIPPSTLPEHLQLSIRGLGSDSGWNQKFQRALVDLLVGCSRFMNLRLLDGVTVGFDYDDALESVDLGYESVIAKSYTNSEELLGVGKLLRVKRGTAVRGHVVLNAKFLGALVDHEHEEFWPTANIVAHELAHVAILGWFEEHSPDVMLQPYQGDWATAALRDVAHTIWEEYAACRLSANIGNDAVGRNYAETVDLSVKSAFLDARERIKEYRTHGDVSRVFAETTGCISNPLKFAAYLLGHLDGTESESEIGTLCPELKGSEFSPFLPVFLTALRDAWDCRHAWDGMKGMDGIVAAVLEVLCKAGVIVTLCDGYSGTRIDIPFSAETMPNGEADMTRY